MHERCVIGPRLLMCGLLCLELAASARAEFGVAVTPPAILNANAVTDAGQDLNPRVASDGKGHWVAVWESDDTLGGTTGSDFDLLVARSIDNGANWSIPTFLNTDAKTDTGTDTVADIATDGNGLWIAVWQSNSMGGAGTNFDILSARSTDNGATWSAPFPLSPNPAVDSVIEGVPRVATDGLGHWVVVWELAGGPSGPPEIVYSRSIDNGVNWSLPAPITNSPMIADEGPAIATDGAGHWVVAWSSGDDLGGTIGGDGDILVARSIDNGANWSLPVPLNADAAIDNLPDANVELATDREGNWVAVWQVSEIGTSAIRSARSIDDGAHWSSPVPIASSNSTGLFGSLHVAYGGGGHWVAAFIQGASGTIGGPIDVLLARSIDNGANWSAPAPIPGNAGALSQFPDRVSVATDGLGQWVTTWAPGNPPDGIGDDTDLRVSRFALPDCNGNRIGDLLETEVGISPDLNGNRVPDVCEVLGLPPAPVGGCGGGICGAGTAAFAPVALAGLMFCRRRARPSDRRS